MAMEVSGATIQPTVVTLGNLLFAETSQWNPLPEPQKESMEQTGWVPCPSGLSLLRDRGTLPAAWPHSRLTPESWGAQTPALPRSVPVALPASPCPPAPSSWKFPSSSFLPSPSGGRGAHHPTQGQRTQSVQGSLQ